MENFIYWLFDKLLSDPINERIFFSIIALAGSYFVNGIRQHIDTNTGKLMNSFLPRCSKQS